MAGISGVFVKIGTLLGVAGIFGTVAMVIVSGDKLAPTAFVFMKMVLAGGTFLAVGII